jgi:hypothetical protein
MMTIGEICPRFLSSGGNCCRREGRGLGGSAAWGGWLGQPRGGRSVRKESVAVVLGSCGEADLTRYGKVLFQGQIHSQYRVFVTGEEKEFVEFELGVDTYSGHWASVISSCR